MRSTEKCAEQWRIWDKSEEVSRLRSNKSLFFFNYRPMSLLHWLSKFFE